MAHSREKSENPENPLELSSEWKNKLLTEMVDYRAETTPYMVYAEYPNSMVTYSAGFKKFTYFELAAAINGVAWWLHENLGPSSTHEALSYIGPNDIRTAALLLGAVKAGYVVR
jgi:acyl-CoA synthetase (AMP-forming)/AMP-acid ligase II